MRFRLPNCQHLHCGCLPQRATVILISVICLASCIVDNHSLERSARQCYPMCEIVHSVRLLIVTLFQMANWLLLLASVVENALLVQIYIWYTLAFVIMGLVVAIAELLLNTTEGGSCKSLSLFLPEVIFLFVVCRCLPLVDKYRQQLAQHAIVVNLKASQYSQGLENPGIKLDLTAEHL